MGISILNATRRDQQSVAANQNALFSDNRVCRGCAIRHDEGSGLVSVKSGLYKISFNGNVTSTIVGPVSFAIKLNGEPLSGGIMTEQISAVGNIANISSEVVVKVPCDSSATITVGNNLTTAALIDNANIVVERLSDCCGNW